MSIRGQKRSGFTLLELIVVVAVIAILTSLSATAFARAKRTGERVACIGKFRQWGQGTHIYASDSDDKLPQEAVFDGINTWEMTAFSVCKDVWYNSLPRTLRMPTAANYSATPSSQRSFYQKKNFFHCPSVKFAPVSATYPNFSMAMNSKLMMDFEAAPPAPSADYGALGFMELKLSQIVEPERTALFLDAGVAGEQRDSEFQPYYMGQPKAFATEFKARHNGGGNIVFAGGNIATLSARRVIDMDPNSPRRGGGIFPARDVVWRHDPALVP